MIHYVINSFSIDKRKLPLKFIFNNQNINTYQRSVRAKEKSFQKIFIEILNRTLPKGSTIVVSLD